MQYDNKSIPGLGLNIARYNVGGCSWNTIGSSDKMSTSPNIPKYKQIEGYWLNWDSDDPQSRSWNWTVDSKQRSMVRKALDRDVNQIEMFSNSPMWWMLYDHNPSGATDGGENLQSWNYRKFAVYLATVAKYAADHWNVMFTSVEPFNEATSGWWKSTGSQEGCHIGSETQQQVIRYLREELDSRGLRHIEVVASDENTYDGAVKLWQSFPIDVRQSVARVNVHGYQYVSGRRDMLYSLVSDDGGKKIWNSEYGEADPSGVPLAQNLLLDMFWLHPTAWIYWQTFDGSNWGLIDSNLGEKQLGRLNPKYYVLSQFCRHIKKGMQILDTNRWDTVAAYDSDKKHLVIVTLNLDKSLVNITYDLSTFGNIANGTVSRWTTAPNNEKIHYVFDTNLKISSKALTVALDAISLHTIEINNKIYSEYKVLKKLPPGPWNLPLIGNLGVFTGISAKTLFDWSKKYGPIFGLQLGSSPTVVLNDWPSIKDALSLCLSRPKENAFTIFGETSFTGKSGQDWKDQRKFALHQLRDLGFGKTSMEEHIIDEINHLCEELIDKLLGTDINVRDLLAITVCNNVSAFLFGRRLEYSDKRKKLIDELVKPNPNFMITGPLAQFPALTRYLINNVNYLLPKQFNRFKQFSDSMDEFFNNEFESHEKTLDSNNFRDYIDAFLNELNKSNPKTSFTRKQLLGNVVNLFGAGTSTTTTIMEWSLVVLATYPDIQSKIRSEIDNIIGRDKTPQYAHRNQMPYLQAFINEVMRFRSIVPINLPRITSEDTVICGHKIAKGTQLLTNLWAIDNDPNLWDNPQVFRPERFLKDNGTVFFKPEHFIPFSLGKRSCPGEAMGTAEVFLYIASLVQRYDIKATKNTDTTLEYLLQFATNTKREPIVSFNKRV
ncbi:uncharacterized protein LOC128963227 [Oppia nitens]|uniref:uncharacterized protein LOC128963227 n=1 Tax=Oppia nitens TaxID=1686743 RepID=UPI0023DA9188|nr:uncharacterized protein LOC128963227 [Oppia nitens]